MREDQELSPKWWVGHDKRQDGVFLATACKSRDRTVVLMEDYFGEDWFIEENFEVILIEIKKVEL